MSIESFLRRLTIAAISMLAIAGAGTGAAYAQSVGIVVNGNPINVNPPPIVQGGRVFVPLRGVFENLGASVVYDNGQINATGDGHDISLHIGSTQATVDGAQQYVDVAPFIIGASTYVPLRFVSQALGASVSYDGTNRVVEIAIAYAAQPAPPPVQAEPPSYAYDDYVTEAPPALPVYEEPPVPEPDYIWQPGYWAWGPGGYYWVPGTWVPAPQPNFYWTPPYWAFLGGLFVFHQGYWADQVGFYGGINYGGGYYGQGYGGGRWESGRFRYNTAVVRVVNTTIITNVYIDRTVIREAPPEHISFNGGPNGVHAAPTQGEIAVGRATHLPITPIQREHIEVASQDHSLLARVNGGKPPVVAAEHPLTNANKPADFAPVTEEDKAAAQRLLAHPTARPAPPSARTAPPLLRTAPPALHTAPPFERTPAPFVRTPAPLLRTPPPFVHTPAPLLRTPPPAFVRTPAPPLRTPPPFVSTPRPFVAPLTPRPTIGRPPHPLATHAGPKPKPKPTPEAH